MDPGSYKFYHLDEFDPKELLATYCSPGSDRTMFEELILFPMSTLRRQLTSSNIRGTTLIDFSTGPIMFHLLPICDYFSDILLLETNDFCIKELEKWLNREEEAFDWSHFSDFFSELKGNRVMWTEKEETLRRKIKIILKCDLSKDNPTDQLELPKADCLMSLYLIQHISKDKEAYCTNIKKLSSLLNVGGHLLLVGGFNGKFFSIGGHRFHSLALDEDFLRKALADGGFAVEHLEILDSNVVNSISQYDQLWFASALKIKEV